MCGIAGVVSKKEGSHLLLIKMMKSIRHRGPDGEGNWNNGSFYLGHLRLSIIDLSESANQPMVDEETGNVIIFNGEIYNYLELKASLKENYNFRTNSDTEVILACYRRYGIEFLQHLRGMFAFAIYDKKKDSILLARDRMGIKPLYYFSGNQEFAFASEIKALLFNQGGYTLNERKAYEFLANRQLDTNYETMFSEINQLPPAHYTWVSADSKMNSPIRYWSFPEMGIRTFKQDDQEELVAKFDEVIKLHLRSDVPIGAFLSGGLDSSSTTCFALRNLKQKELNVFSGILPYFQEENSLIGEIVNKDHRVKPHQFMLDGKGFFQDLPSIIWHHDEPILDGSMYAHYKLCELAGKNNIKVLLSGSGGDELFGGYFSHIAAHLGKQVKKFELKAFLKSVHNIGKNSNYSNRSLFFKGIIEALPIGIRRNIRNRQLKIVNKHLSKNPIIPHFYYENTDPYYANFLNNYLSWTVPPYLHYEDRNSMAFGVEIRVPFYDHKLIEYIMQFRSDEFINGRSKSILRDSFENIVPEKILNQKGKFGFPSPIDHALKYDQTGKEIFFDLYKQTPMLNLQQTRKLANDFYNGKGNLGAYWRTLSFCIWYDIFFKGQIPSK